jgi:hypothetical protein
MSDTTERTYTLAEVRAAVVGALVNEGYSETEAMGRAKYAYPDPEPPEPERRWVTNCDGHEDSRDPSGKWWWRAPGSPVHVYPSKYTDEFVRALASLLPRVPVTVTEEMVEKAMRAYWDRGHHGVTEAIRAALSAVASDLAQPVHACQHTAQWWAVVRRDGRSVWGVYRSEGEAATACDNIVHHRVVALAEVDHD